MTDDAATRCPDCGYIGKGENFTYLERCGACGELKEDTQNIFFSEQDEDEVIDTAICSECLSQAINLEEHKHVPDWKQQ